MPDLYITVHSPLGTFTGAFRTDLGDQATSEQLWEVAHSLQASTGNMSGIILVEDDGEEMVFYKNILEQSVIKYKVRE